ncbi:MAG TPA: SGNH/GDSL hydrolase family protein [Candidatus Baltobacteraceae bacterium]|nr:SGNH/GDSL hydrolase family protein [Candidatus Baltobacteraceae bacterium]
MLALFALGACGGSGSGGTVALPPSNTPNAGLAQQNFVGIGDSLTAGEQSGGLLGDPSTFSAVSALPPAPSSPGIVPVTQENGWWALFYQQAAGTSASSVLPLIKGPGLGSQLVVSAQAPGFAPTHSDCDTFNLAAFSQSNWPATRINPAAAIADLAVPGMTMHEAVSMTAPLTSPPTGAGCGFVTIAGDPTSGGLQSLVAGESGMFYPILGQFAATLQPGTATQLNAAVSLKPQLTTVWLGANDLLKFIFSHGNSPATDSPQQFAADLTQIVTTLQKAGSKVVVANLPDILGNGGSEPPVPQFFPISKVGADLTAITGGRISAAAGLQIQGYLQATYTGASGFLTESGFFGVLSQLQTNPAALPNLDPSGPGSGEGALYLDSAFAVQAIALNGAYNQAIGAVASSTGAALADIQTAFQQINAAGGVTLGSVTLTTRFGGGLLSYDGLHPSNTTYALLANVFIGAADVKFAMTIPPLSNAQIGAIAQTDTYNPYVIKAVNPLWPYPLP